MSTLVEDDYEVERYPFAEGATSRLFRCRCRRTGTLYAVKQYDKQRAGRRRCELVRNEARIGTHLPASPHLVHTIALYENEKTLSLVMEYMEGGSLFDWIRTAGPVAEGGVAQRIVRQILTGLVQLHASGVMHRDIKPENIFRRSSVEDTSTSVLVVAIGDFGFATDHIPSADYLGSPQYSAPEMALLALRLQQSHTTTSNVSMAKALYNEKCDVWAVGVVTFVLLTGLLPFDGSTPTEVFTSVLRNAMPLEKLPRGLSPSAKSFILSLTTTNPSARPSATKALQHAWLNDTPAQGGVVVRAR